MTTINRINDNDFNTAGETNLANIYELIATQAMKILLNEAMLI